MRDLNIGCGLQIIGVLIMAVSFALILWAIQQ